MARMLRIGILLFVLLVVAQTAWIARARTTDWKEPLRVVVYPINADASAAADGYLARLKPDAFEPLAAYMREQAGNHGLSLRAPVEIYLAPTVTSAPPEAPRERTMASAVLWSLHLRFWAWRHDGYSGPKAHVRVFVKYFAPTPGTTLAHSIGLREGLIGVVNAFASSEMTGANQVVIAHELLHTFGALDKYDPATSLPVFPDGYAEPNANPLYPQNKAEIMAGRVPVSQRSAEMPASLDETMIGARTAREINWVK